LSGYFGGWLDSIVMRGVDVMFSLPSILLAIVIMAILGTGLEKAMIAIGITYAPQIARIVRSQTIIVKIWSLLKQHYQLVKSYYDYFMTYFKKCFISYNCLWNFEYRKCNS